MENIIDISHSIKSSTDLSFRKESIVPDFLYLEDATEGDFLVHMQINNLLMTYGTHVCFPGALPRPLDFSQEKIVKNNVSNFIGKVQIIDISFLYNDIKHFFCSGKLNIDLYNEVEIANYLNSLSQLEINNEIFEKILLCDLSSCAGVLFYTGLSDYWCYEKFDIAEHIYFQSINLSKEICDRLINNKVYFIGIDAFTIGNPFAIYSGYEKIFMSVPELVFNDYFDKNQHNAHQYLLQNGLSIYKNIKLSKYCINSVKYFSGVPINFSSEIESTSSIVRPYLYDE